MRLLGVHLSIGNHASVVVGGGELDGEERIRSIVHRVGDASCGVLWNYLSALLEKDTDVSGQALFHLLDIMQDRI